MSPGAPTASAELLLMTLADSRLPTGGHTQSAGLEPALLGGLPPAEIPAYLAARLRSTVRVDAATAVVARHRALTGGDLAEVRDAWAARTPSPAQRAAAEELGRGYLRLVSRLWPAAPATTALTALRRPPRPLVVGAVAALAGLAADQCARLVAYEEVQAVAAAALKLAPFDPVVATSWVLAAHGPIAALAAEVAPLTEPRAIPAPGAPLAEAWAQAHAARTERIFRA